MKPIVAVRITGHVDDEVMTGYVNRGKNRRVVWAAIVTGMTPAQRREKALEKELSRQEGSEAQQRVLPSEVVL